MIGSNPIKKTAFDINRLASILLSMFLFVFFVACTVSAVAAATPRVLYMLAVPAILIITALYISSIGRVKNIYVVHLIIFFIAFLLRFFWVVRGLTVPTSDFLTSYVLTNKALNGDFSETVHLETASQIYHSFFLSLYSRLVGLGVVRIGILNAAMHSLIANILYEVGKDVFKNKSIGLASACFFTFFPQQILYNSVISNQITAASLGWIGILFFVKAFHKRSYLCGVVSGIFFASAIMVRSDSGIILYALIVFIPLCLVTYMIDTKIDLKEKLNKIKGLLPLVLIIITCYIAQNIIEDFFRKNDMNLSGAGGANAIFYFQIAMGNNIESNGRARPEYYDVLVDKSPNNYSEEEKKDYFIEIIKQNAKDPRFLSFHKDKFARVWTASYNHWSFFGVSEKAVSSLREFIRLGDWMYAVVLFLSCLSAFRLRKERNASLSNYFSILMLGAFLMITIMIGNGRYKYFSQTFMMLFAGGGLSVAVALLKRSETCVKITDDVKGWAIDIFSNRSYKKRIIWHRIYAVAFALIFVLTGLSVTQLGYKEALPIITDAENNRLQTVSKLGQLVDRRTSAASWIDLYGFAQKVLNKFEISNFEIIKDKQGFLHAPSKSVNEKRLDQYAENLNNVYESSLKLGIPFLYVQAASEYVQGVTALPEGMSETSNSQLDSFLLRLSEKNVPHLDTRRLISELPEGIHPFYRTDPHWSSDMSFLVTQNIIETLDSLYNANLDPNRTVRNPANYETVLYPDGLLGAYGRKTGRFYVKKDDFKIFYPNFETSLKYRTINTNGEVTAEKEGGFDETVIYQSALRVDYDNKYSALMSGSAYVCHIDNALADNDTKILVITNTFGNSVTPYLSLSCGETLMLNQEKAFKDRSLEDYCESFSPDYIIMLYGGNNIYYPI